MSQGRLHLMIPCARVAHHVQEYLDLRLHTSAGRTIHTHLRHCPNCSAYLDSLKKMVFLYQRVASPRPSAAMKRRLHTLLHRQFVAAHSHQSHSQKDH
ncbi:MAG: hypothetical protein MUF82_00270 [Bacteroidetes bacterium]|nr:hypothetical protein [Bacteroidota bacterium]